ncbi:PAS domain-containing sensor histidine kinase [Vibrio fujianensis]|uniref:PAS domain-containing sensor histidine kinase n=1 Tax=Vibrio fujianensis TaxID=1974215 RepID=UPI001561C841|nr:ATP-binding protein [Vibrio fujianensis]
MRKYAHRRNTISKIKISHLGKRVSIIVFAISLVFTLIFSFIQTKLAINQEIAHIENRQLELDQDFTQDIGTFIWNYEFFTLQLRLNALENLSHIDYLQVTSDHYTFHSGEKGKEPLIKKSFPILYKNNIVGDIYVESSLQSVYQDIYYNFFHSLSVNLLKTGLLCLVILYIFHYSINVRLTQMVKYLKEIDPHLISKKLILFKKPIITSSKDEISKLGSTINKLTINLYHLYDKIRKEKDRLNDFTQVSSDWLWETDCDGMLVFASDSMKKTLQMDSNETVSLFDICKKFNFNHLEENLKKNKPFNLCEEKLASDNISGSLILIFQAVIKNDINHQFLGYRGTAIDVTDLYLAQHQLKEINQNLEKKVTERTLELKHNLEQLQKAQTQLIETEKLAALGSLVAGVAHEVNTPLGVAVTSNSIIQETINDLKSQFETQTLTADQFSILINEIQDATQLQEHNLNRAAKLIKDFKQTAVDQVSEVKTEYVIFQVLQSLINSLHSETKKVPVSPKLDGDHHLVMYGFPGILSQIFSNLIMNSIKHAFNTQKSPEISIRFYQEDNEIIFIYQDNGSGVAPKLHEKIFEPFYTTQRAQGGSGLGLNIVYNLIKKQLKGDLKFDSDIDQGVTYTIILPKLLS